MNDFALNLIVFGVVLFAGAGIFMLVRRYQAGNALKISRIAAENGWFVRSGCGIFVLARYNRVPNTHQRIEPRTSPRAHAKA